MKIVMPTIGTRGDVQPYITLAIDLQRAGHTVTLASHPVVQSLATSHGVPFAPMGPDIDLGRETALIRGRSRNWLLGFMRVMRFTFKMLEESHADLLALCRQADLVIVAHSGAGSMEADKLKLPTVSVTLFPQAIPVTDPAQPLFRRLLGKLAGAGMGLLMTRPLNQIRRRVGLPPMGPAGITSPHLNLIPISPLVAPPDPRWEARHQVVGYWFANEMPGWSPPSSLQAFLAEGEPPVVVSLGAMSLGSAGALETTQLMLVALEEAGARAVIQGWDDILPSLALPANVYHAGSLPHKWLLARAACLVHHGGFGTTAASLGAGIPAVVIPHIIDQFIWGQRVFELGVGPKPIPRSKLTRVGLSAALEQALHNATMRCQATDLGVRIRAETGVETAVRLIEGCFPAISMKD